jgi:acetyltransferase-like isoleucine patch superfamily enzyme
MECRVEITVKQVSDVCIYPHPDIHKGILYVGENTSFDLGCMIDITGNIHIGNYCMIGRGTRILTHDHYHVGRVPLLLLQDHLGIKWQDKCIGDDVWFHDCIVLMQVDYIPDGVVIGAGSVLTKNPEVPYGIYAGNPAVLVGER